MSATIFTIAVVGSTAVLTVVIEKLRKARRKWRKERERIREAALCRAREESRRQQEETLRLLLSHDPKYARDLEKLITDKVSNATHHLAFTSKSVDRLTKDVRDLRSEVREVHRVLEPWS